MMRPLFLPAFATALLLVSPAFARPTVVELFTSQGCVACPAADAMLKSLAEDPSILPLSFHVHYWDKQGWTDPFSSEDNTERQRDYDTALKVDSLFTPQMVIDGQVSAVGSESAQVTEAIQEARAGAVDIPVTITPDASGDKLHIAVGDAQNPAPKDADVYEIHFNIGKSTEVTGGENDGQTLESTNNVMEIIPLVLAPGYTLPMSRLSEDGIAVLVQEKGQGRILGAAVYMKNKNAAVL